MPILAECNAWPSMAWCLRPLTSHPRPQHLPRASPSCEGNTNCGICRTCIVVLYFRYLDWKWWQRYKTRKPPHPGPNRRQLHPGGEHEHALAWKLNTLGKNVISLVQKSAWNPFTKIKLFTKGPPNSPYTGLTEFQTYILQDKQNNVSACGTIE